jgi:hypothetical protein
MYIRFLAIFLACSIIPIIASGIFGSIFTNSSYVGLLIAGLTLLIFATSATAYFFCLAMTIEAMREVLEKLTIESIVAATTGQPIQKEEEEDEV